MVMVIDWDGNEVNTSQYNDGEGLKEEEGEISFTSETVDEAASFSTFQSTISSSIHSSTTPTTSTNEYSKSSYSLRE